LEVGAIVSLVHPKLKFPIPKCLRFTQS